MALASLTQDDFSGGAYTGRRSPANAVFAAVDAIITDEGYLARRGGTAYKSTTNTDSDLIGIDEAVLPSGRVTLFWSATKLWKLDTDDATPVEITLGAGVDPPRPGARGAGVEDKWLIPSNASPDVLYYDGTSAIAETYALAGDAEYVTAVGSPARVIVTSGNLAYYTDRGDPGTISDPAHELPQNAQIIGADAIDDNAVLFTTSGIWMIQNMAFDPVDAFGNIQHSVAKVSDLILWGDPGVVGWQGGFVVPCVDDIYLWGPDGQTPITGARGSQYDGGIRDLYRSYVTSYTPGGASIFKGTYILPILNGSTVVDVLTCRLDRGSAWASWSGHAASPAYATRIGSSTRSPLLLGVKTRRVTNLTGCFTPTISNPSDADGTAHSCVITTRDLPTGGNQHGFVQRLRARYELVDGGTPDPAVAVACSSDQDAGVFTTLTERGAQGGGAGWAASDGSKYQWALVGKRRERIRFRFTVTGACASFVLRSIELLLRPTGKQ